MVHSTASASTQFLLLLAFMRQAHHPTRMIAIDWRLMTSFPSAIVFWSVPAGTC
ncbi:exported hypothetical protein [Cupriavidus taiwanensis]|uniref:Uncharacterized protein n=1 Tax=Cupriavidus taiwanensis TaxID=164546 RepID=A0A7Z7JEP3_9BURK|nr:exported hypothetical protein [Cupriavidus taiwanensis]SOZ21465.1 exported hypothetical protein [Cupriavidus taiwanensis]SPC25191.1 exported hypothetical protein [Cupriavidus taiwanensis]